MNIGKEYYKNGPLKCKRTYENGILEGLVTSYYENGQLSTEAVYKDGKAEGRSAKISGRQF